MYRAIAIIEDVFQTDTKLFVALISNELGLQHAACQFESFGIFGFRLFDFVCCRDFNHGFLLGMEFQIKNALP